VVLKGHVCDGVIVLDDYATLPDGTPVLISIESTNESTLPYRRYRGTPCSFDNPLEPVSPSQDWEATH